MVRESVTVPSMDMLPGDQIARANQSDWRKVGQGRHARHVVSDVGAGVRFVAVVVAAGGVVVDDSQAPSYTVIADPDGNKACVCTALPPGQSE